MTLVSHRWKFPFVQMNESWSNVKRLMSLLSVYHPDSRYQVVNLQIDFSYSIGRYEELALSQNRGS